MIKQQGGKQDFFFFTGLFLAPFSPPTKKKPWNSLLPYVNPFRRPRPSRQIVIVICLGAIHKLLRRAAVKVHSKNSEFRGGARKKCKEEEEEEKSWLRNWATVCWNAGGVFFFSFALFQALSLSPKPILPPVQCNREKGIARACQR